MAVYGMPADCVKLGRARLVEEPLDLVISGINAGCNVGVHTLYSGTVAAAREAAMAGIPAISMSLFLRNRDEIRWGRASELARECLERIVADRLEPGTFLNINLPILDDGREPKGVRVAPALLSAMVDDYRGEPNDEGHGVYEVGRGVAFGEVHDDTDAKYLFQGYITVTPMIFNPTDYDAVGPWRDRLNRDA
jgi:5'-nucleotidase